MDGVGARPDKQTEVENGLEEKNEVSLEFNQWILIFSSIVAHALFGKIEGKF